MSQHQRTYQHLSLVWNTEVKLGGINDKVQMFKVQVNDESRQLKL